MKKIILIVTSSLFLMSNISISAETDCSNPKGFHQKLVCKNFKSNPDNENAGKKKGFFKNPFKKLNDVNTKTKKTLFKVIKLSQLIKKEFYVN